MKAKKKSFREGIEETKNQSVSSLDETLKDDEIDENDPTSQLTEENKFSPQKNLQPIDTKVAKAIQEDSAEPETVKNLYNLHVNNEPEQTFIDQLPNIEKEHDEGDASPDKKASIIKKKSETKLEESDSDDDDFIIKPSKRVF